MRWRIERKRRMYGTTVVVAIDHWAQVPECPPVIAFETWYACGVDLQKVEGLDGVVIRDASEEDEEHHGEGTSDEDEGKQSE